MKDNTMKKHFIDSIPAHVWILLKDDRIAAHIIWKYTKSRVYCSMLTWGDNIYNNMFGQEHIENQLDINYSKIAYADGNGYCKFSAAFENLMLMHGFKIRDVAGMGENAVEKWLEKTFAGTKVWRII
ncbi:MAG: hypothetical protein KA799_01300 [Bacteroidales bacterium]|nr:hypothetical protein [Bacteroidales bacterium]